MLIKRSLSVLLPERLQRCGIQSVSKKDITLATYAFVDTVSFPRVHGVVMDC